MLPLKRLDHISMAAPSWKPQAEKLESLLGFKFLHGFGANSASGFGGCVTQVPGTEIEFEILDPSSPQSFVQKFLDEQGPGLHHITLEVTDIHEAAAELERLGIKPFGGISDDGQWLLTYIHPKDSGGILWQLFVPKEPPPTLDRSTGNGAIGLKRVDHVSTAVPDREKQIDFLTRVLGFTVDGRFTDEEGGFIAANLSIPGSLLRFEVMQPTRPDSFVQAFIDKRRAGMHHICCEVESVDAAAAALRQAGIEPFGGVVENHWRKHTFIHPRDSGGVLFQLFEQPA